MKIRHGMKTNDEKKKERKRKEKKEKEGKTNRYFLVAN